MKLGVVSNPEMVDFTMPEDALETLRILKKGKEPFETYVGCAKWNKGDLKGFSSKGTKDELTYYGTQFN